LIAQKINSKLSNSLTFLAKQGLRHCFLLTRNQETVSISCYWTKGNCWNRTVHFFKSKRQG